MFDYKSLPKVPGIYLITNTVNNKVWVGQGLNLFARGRGHQSLFKRGKNSPYLQKAWEKYGRESFKIEVLLLCPLEQIDYWEDYYLGVFESWKRNKGYNLERFSKGNGPRSKEVRDKISLSSFGKIISEETKRRSSESHRGQVRPWTEESKKKISKTMVGNCNGKFISPEGRQKRSERFTGTIWVFNPETGIRKRILSHELESFISGGWKRGKNFPPT